MSRAPVSVVMACYRGAATIERALRSVAAQTWLPAEVIVVDDASDDATPALLGRLAGTFPWLKIIRFDRNQGAASARNAGWEAASQPLVAFLDADDAWHPRKLELQTSFMLDHPAVAITGHGCRQADAWPQPAAGVPASWVAVPVTASAMLYSNRLSTPSVMLRRDLPLRFCPGKRYAEDYLLWLQILLRGHPGARLQCDLAYLFKAAHGEGGLSAHLWRFEVAELDTYLRLARQGLISRWLLAVLLPFSLLKFLRRVLLGFWSRRRKAGRDRRPGPPRAVDGAAG